ncbi:hypothetical protein, partial [Pandoraea sputorum]|uniref:hypothetical protein n=1 Tax=Pandoraea sputorum TaxID=93222 RepID=UPI00355828C7
FQLIVFKIRKLEVLVKKQTISMTWPFNLVMDALAAQLSASRCYAHSLCAWLWIICLLISVALVFKGMQAEGQIMIRSAG